MSEIDELQRLFEWALAFAPEERERALLAESGSVELTERVLRLIAADSDASRDPEEIVLETLERSAPALLGPGSQLGPYRLLEPIGSGGMGTVFLAERTGADFEQRVAIKVVRDGLFDPKLLERLVLERRILSRLEHPHIARLYDGGTTPAGAPYLVMEYVDGRPIDRYCDEQGYDVEPRLRLFQLVCRAVQAAHRRLVVHRDLKPGNILVTREGEPKLLDFGIAKLLGEEDAAATRTVMRAMTPAYASPEQVRGEVVTTASDVYSLGAVLYELLSGRRPFSLSGASPAEVERLICETEPPPPSSATEEVDPQDEDSGGRGFLPDPTRVRGDLDTIVLKALAKEPERRYGSPAELADDVERFLSGRPVIARPATWGYRTKKFLSRHRWPVAAAALVATLLVVFSVSTALQSRRLARERDAAERERAKAEAVVELMVSIFEDADSTTNRGLELTAGEILERGEERLVDLEATPAVRAAAADAVGRVYRNLAEYEKARSLQRQALEDNRTVHGERHEATANSLIELARVERDAGELEEAYDLASRALALRRELFEGPDPTAAIYLNVLGSILHRQGRLEEAEEEFAAGLAEFDAQRESSGEVRREDRTSLSLLGNLGNLLIDRGRYDEARQLLERSLAGGREVEGERSLDRAITLNNLAGVVEIQGDWEAADRYYRESIQIREELLPGDHPSLLKVRANFATFKLRQGEAEVASELLAEVIDALKARGTDGFDLGFPLSNYAIALYRSGELDAAAEAFEESLREIEREGGEGHVLSAYALNGYAVNESRRGNEAAAERLFRRALAVREAGLERGHPMLAFSNRALGSFLLARERSAEARPHLAAALEAYGALSEPDSGEVDEELLEARLLLSLAERDQGREEESVELARQALVSLEAVEEENRPELWWQRARCFADGVDCAEVIEAAQVRDDPTVDARFAEWASRLSAD